VSTPATAPVVVTPVVVTPVVVTPVVVTHGGATSVPALSKDGTDKAAAAGLAAIARGASALDGAIAAVVVLEDDPRFNAGTGSSIRLDGRTIQMDAAIHDGASGDYGAVAAIERVQNPVLVARRVIETPHLLIVGDGATRFARAMGFADYYPDSGTARARFARVLDALRGRGDDTQSYSTAWQRYDWKKAWNFGTKLSDVLGTPDTVGAVARDAGGRYAAAISTGGTSITFLGRVGDVPMYGCGIYAGPDGAVAATGHGEDIIKKLLAKTVYDDLAAGTAPQQAVDKAIRLFPADVGIGVIAISAAGFGGGGNRGNPADFRANMSWSAAG
jgi:L-asparaginase/beta-aspartyl-peptidase (threonine type)